MTTMRLPESRRIARLETTPRALAQSRVLPFPTTPARLAMTMGQSRRMGLWWVMVLALIWCALVLTARPVAAQSFQIFVPIVLTDEGPTGSGEDPVECGLNSQEQAVANRIASHPDQGRDNPVCDPILAQVARGRARDMALRGYFAHTNSDGIGPNFLVRQAGYPLPDWYGDDRDSNNIESIGGGQATPDEIWQGWQDSQAHRTHILGTQSFYSAQRAYGVGYYFNPDAPWKHYWVFISAPIE